MRQHLITSQQETFDEKIRRLKGERKNQKSKMSSISKDIKATGRKKKACDKFLKRFGTPDVLRAIASKSAAR
jgi:uncharacterized protein (UPF0335 family)